MPGMHVVNRQIQAFPDNEKGREYLEDKEERGRRKAVYMSVYKGNDT